MNELPDAALVVVAVVVIGGGLVYIVFGERIAKWIGNKIADLGGGGPRL